MINGLGSEGIEDPATIMKKHAEHWIDPWRLPTPRPSSGVVQRRKGPGRRAIRRYRNRRGCSWGPFDGRDSAVCGSVIVSVERKSRIMSAVAGVARRRRGDVKFVQG